MSNFLFYPLETNRKSKKPIPLPSSSVEIKVSWDSALFLLSFTFLEKKFSFVHRGNFCFIRFDGIITKDNWVRLSSQLGESELSCRHGGAPAASEFLTSGDDQGCAFSARPAVGSTLWPDGPIILPEYF